MGPDKRRMLLFILIFLTGPGPQDGFADPLTVLRDTVRQYKEIVTIDAFIEQSIKSPDNSLEIFKGRYRAQKSGTFRIDYSLPFPQQVLHTGRDLYWYYRDDNILYHIKNNNYNLKPKYNPLHELREIFNKDFLIEYAGKHLYGFFAVAHNYIITSRKDDLIFDVWIDAKRKVVLAKIVKNRSDYEIIKELYQDYKLISGIYFPTRVDVFVRTKKGVLRNTTIYKNIKINRSLPQFLFQYSFPSNAIVKKLNQ